MTKLITLLTVLLLSNIAIADCGTCDQGTHPGSIEVPLLLAQEKSDANIDELEEDDYLSITCSYSRSRDMVKIAKTINKAGRQAQKEDPNGPRKSFTNLDYVYSIKCDGRRSIFEIMILHANDNALKDFIKYYKTRKGEAFAAEFLNYEIPNRFGKPGMHTLLDFAALLHGIDKDLVNKASYKELMSHMRDNGAVRKTDNYLDAR